MYNIFGLVSIKARRKMPASRIGFWASTGSRLLWRLFSQLKFAALLLLVVLLLAAFGSSLPQIPPEVAEDASRLAFWREAVRGKYGPFADLLWSLGLFRFSRSALFLAPLALLVVSTILCTLNRWRGVCRRALNRDVVCPEAVFESSPHRARLEAQADTRLWQTLRESLRERGFRLRSATSEGVLYLRAERNGLSPLATLVNHFALLLLLAGALLSGFWAWREELVIPPGETARISHSQGLALRNDGFTIRRYPSRAAASYEANVTLIEEGEPVRSGLIRLNMPLAHRYVRLYLRGYEGKEGAYTLRLLAGYDPGYPLFVIAGCIFLVSLCVSFFLPHACIQARMEPEGALHLAGHADRQAYAFAEEFASLIAELRQRMEKQDAS